jgi:translation elongation factor EF-1beta
MQIVVHGGYMEEVQSMMHLRFTIEELEAAHYIAMGLPVKNVCLITGIAKERLKELQKNDAFLSEIASARVNIATGLSAIKSAIVGLSAEKILDILSQDYNTVGENERREIARTARFAIGLDSAPTQNQGVTNNLIVAEDGVKVLARHIALLQGQDFSGDIENEFSIQSVAETYSCAPGTAKGILNYDPETDEFQCHICGGWIKDIDRHSLDHGLDYADYKRIFDING